MSVTVVTPSLPERGKMLAEAVHSVNRQTVLPAAHLISVDYHNHGPGPLLNQLIRAAETEWVSILADDDLYQETHLEHLSEASEDADIVYSWGQIAGSTSRAANQYRGPFDPDRLLNRQDSGLSGCFMVRKTMWDLVGGWRDEPTEDWGFLVRCLKAGARVRLVPKVTWIYRFHGGNVSQVLVELANGREPRNLYHLATWL
jgi:hypothetical protein